MKLIFESGNLSKMVRNKRNSLKAKHQARLTNGRFVSPFESLGDQFDRYARHRRETRRAAKEFMQLGKPTPKPAAIEKNPLVTFDYPKSDAPWQIWHRCVRLISADATHYTGLEQTPKGWKYKKFLTSKARHLKVVSFNTMAMS